jgi:ABC-2 type transport system permease protein
MALFWEFFSFEIKLRLKSASTYVYFGIWFLISFLSIAAQDFLNPGNDKILLNGPFSTSILYTLLSFFGMLVMAAIFGSSILRDFQQNTYQLIFTKPITKFAYLKSSFSGRSSLPLPRSRASSL